MKKICFYTLGCKSNQYETDRMAREAAALGMQVVPYPSPADIYVINTCTVTSNAAKKSRNAVRHSKKLNPMAKVIFTGCDAGIESIPEADLILSNKDKKDLFTKLQSLIPDSPLIPNAYPLTPRVRANLMIEDGCENFCSYCIVPYVRGKVRSKPVNEVMAEARDMVANGVKEIVLTGINLGEFSHLTSLISALSSLDGLLRIRLSSIEPMYITDELIDIVKSDPKVCKHFHIPMQSGDDGILKAMKRTYTAKAFIELGEKIKREIKDIAITTDVIAGFPGEDNKAFRNSCSIIDKLRFSRIHVFSYSDRPGTAASRLEEKIDPKEIAKRHEMLLKLRDRHMLAFHRTFKARKMEVLVEQGNNGLTSNYVRVFLENNRGRDLTGKLVECRFRRFAPGSVTATLL